MKSLSARVARQRRSQESPQTKRARRPKPSKNVGAQLAFLQKGSFFATRRAVYIFRAFVMGTW